MCYNRLFLNTFDPRSICGFMMTANISVCITGGKWIHIYIYIYIDVPH